MKYRLHAARLLAASHGDRYTPEQSLPPQDLALKLDGAADLQRVLSGQVPLWVSPELSNPEIAMAEARGHLAAELSKVFGNKPCELRSSAIAYKPVYDKDGNIIGHDTVAWLYVDGRPLLKEGVVTGSVTLGLIGCVLLSIGPA